MSFESRVRQLKCEAHKMSITYLCFQEGCKEKFEACGRCILKHKDHSDKLLYVKEVGLFLKGNTTVNQVIQNPIGVQTYRYFQTFKQNIINVLNELENELRQLILSHIEDQQLNDLGQLFLKEIQQFEVKDLGTLRNRLLERCKIEKTRVDIIERDSKQQLENLMKEIEKNLKPLETQLLGTLQSVNTVFYTKEDTIQRLQKVWIDNEGQSRPGMHINTTLRVNSFKVKDQPLFLVGLHQPQLYKGCFNGTLYDSQSKPHTIKYKVHQGYDLTQSIYEYQVTLEHQKMQIVDGHCYYLNFGNPLKLYPNTEYCISISTSENKMFYTYQYQADNHQNQYIEFQSEDLVDSPLFTKSPYIQNVLSYYSIDQLPSLVVKYKK